MAPTNSNETYCTFTLASDVTAGGLPSEQDIAKDLESTDTNVRSLVTSRVVGCCMCVLYVAYEALGTDLYAAGT
jgi:hypothetical protein